MEDQKLDVSSISFVSGDRIDANLLLDYFMAMFPGRAEVLGRIWRWLNRIEFYNNQTPFVAVYDNRVIAYFGMMPFAVSLDSVRRVATWSIDYSVLPEFQRHGLGVVLLKKWMELPDVQVGFANVRAIGACRKAGLGECDDTRLHYFLLNPFDHPRLVRSMPPRYEEF
ncbi:MAG: GNAT family N-acetyltransferase [Candidatus Eiseniibacteriota bacterium]|nr:MAG: GNAT family N-acetyltransferase [Candidatus Eisenbacteria bacterium]